MREPADLPGNRDRRRRERGSALLLFPAGFLVLIILAAIAFDFTLAFQQKRQLLDLAGSAANDAATWGLDERRLRADGQYCLDPSRAASAVAANVASSTLAAEILRVEIAGSAPDCSQQVIVVLAREAPANFLRAVPGVDSLGRLVATKQATAVER